MSDLLALLNQQIDSKAVSQLSNQIGADSQSTSKAISSALPLLVSALAKNTQGGGTNASALLGALDRDHDGSILDDVVGFLGQGKTSPGEAILGHVLGGRTGNAAQGVSRMSGLDSGKVMQLLALLAPVVMGALGKVKRQQDLGPDGLAGLLQSERKTVQRQAPEGASMLEQLLDADGDGSIGDDVARLGASMLGNLFGGRR